VDKWKIKERDDAEAFQGKRTKGSGNQWANRGDIKSGIFLIEAKSTDKKSFSITQNLWKKIWEEAIQTQRIPILSIRLNKNDMDMVVLERRDFLELIKGGE
jgi:hypothetical protein